MLRRRLLPLLLVLSAFGALCAVAPWRADAQDLAARKEELERRKASLDGQIAEQDRALAAADAQIAETQAALSKATVQLELVMRSPVRKQVFPLADAQILIPMMRWFGLDFSSSEVIYHGPISGIFRL